MLLRSIRDTGLKLGSMRLGIKGSRQAWEAEILRNGGFPGQQAAFLGSGGEKGKGGPKTGPLSLS
jgi:hypothetical protein